MKSRIPVFQSSMSRRKIEKIRLLGENLEPCRHSLAPSTLSIALTVKPTYVTQVYELRAPWSSGETDIGSRIFFEVVSEGKQVVNVPSEFVCQ